jgi:hypothetical protein
MTTPRSDSASGASSPSPRHSKSRRAAQDEEDAARADAKRARRSTKEKAKREATRASQAAHLDSIDRATLAHLRVFDAVPEAAHKAVVDAVCDMLLPHLRQLERADVVEDDDWSEVYQVCAFEDSARSPIAVNHDRHL